MASESISISGGSFVVEGNTNFVTNDNPETGFTTISGENGQPVTNTTFIATDDKPVKIVFESTSAVAAQKLTAQLTNVEDEALFIGSVKSSYIGTLGGDDVLASEFQLEDSTARTNRGADNLSIGSTNNNQPAAVNSAISSGKGNDELVFGGAVVKSEVVLGAGADVARFQGDVRNVQLSLSSASGTPDGDVDTVFFDANANLKGLVITGAGEGDILFIGNAKYEYNPVDNTWIGSNGDIKTFSK